MSDRETVVLGAVCMLLSTGLCLALSVGLSREPADRAQRVRRRMSVVAADVAGAKSIKSGVSRRDFASTRPAHMNALVADLGRAEMDIRMKRGIAMILSMAIGMGIFLGLRALRSRPIGPVVIRLKEREAA